MATMKDLEGRLDGVEGRLARLEELTGAGTPEDAEAAQVAADEELLARNATSYEEAVAQDQARERMARRAGLGDEEPAAESAPTE